jgi:membrane-bound ClpP family serine protease
MDLGIVVALIMLVVWGVWTFALSAPGWAHILLTVGVFLLFYRIVVRGTPGYAGDRKD